LILRDQVVRRGNTTHVTENNWPKLIFKNFFSIFIFQVVYEKEV